MTGLHIHATYIDAKLPKSLDSKDASGRMESIDIDRLGYGNVIGLGAPTMA